MALLFLDSFDHYVDGSDKYLAGSASIGPGRHGNGCTGQNRCAVSPTSSRMLIGAAYKFNSTYQEFVGFADQHLTLGKAGTDNNGSVWVMLFGGDTVYSASDVVRVGQWHYIEIDITVTAETRVFASEIQARYAFAPARIRVDGALVLNASLPATLWMNGVKSAANWAVVDFFPFAFGTYDDVYISDGAGPAPWNAPLGDIQIDVIRPNGVGAVTQWTLVGATSNWEATNDQNPDDDTTKVTAATTGLSDLYEMEDINTYDAVLGAQLLINARRTEEGFAALTPLIRHAGTTSPLETRHISPSYFYRNRVPFVTMPNGDPLTDININAMQAGFRRDV
jgi:hypothetical protein